MDWLNSGAIVVKTMPSPLAIARATALALLVVVGGCAGGAGGGDPSAQALPAGQSCQSVRAELGKLDAKGTRAKVEAASRGQKLSPQAQGEVDRYNELLNAYLGARCHA
jgi:hypothetical protein